MPACVPGGGDASLADRDAQPTQLQPFTDVLQLQGFMNDPGLILDRLPNCWNVPELDAGCCEAFAVYAETVGTPERILAQWREMHARAPEQLTSFCPAPSKHLGKPANCFDGKAFRWKGT